MLGILRRIVQEVNAAHDLDQVLDIIVSNIKKVMVVDAASVYLSENDLKQLVLMKTDGLNLDAVGEMRLAVDEGLTGYVTCSAETVNIACASEDRRYLDIPGSGDGEFNAYLGVPVVHQRRVLGALVVQRYDKRKFSEDSVGFLVALASQLAAGILHAQLMNHASVVLSRDTGKEKYFNCVPGAPGVAIGTAVVVYSSTDFDSIPDRKVDNVEKEIEIFRKAVKDVRDDIKLMQQRLFDVLSEEDNALFDAYVLLACGDSLVNETTQRIKKGNWAQGALRTTIQEQSLRFNQIQDEYMRERADDVREIGLRIFRKLHADDSVPCSYPKRTILVGEEIGATQLAEVPTKRIAGIISAKGSHSSHVAILARSMGIPAIMGAGNVAIGWLDQCEVIADGYQGRIYVDPPPLVLAEYGRLIREDSQLKKDLKGLRKQPAETPDGVNMTLLINSGLLSDEKSSSKSGGGGVGLYRTEFPFMMRESFPSEAEQIALYRNVLKAYHPCPVTIRTLDIGGDKSLPYFPVVEDNPALGWRGMRMTLDHPEILITQIKAMLKASVGYSNLQILFPMLTNLSELDEAQTLFEQALYEVEKEGHQIDPPKTGAMIEVPSAARQAEAFAKRVDFLSVGTNDLTQYMLAVDRNNARVSNLYDHFHPAVLHVVMDVVEAARRQVKPVSICGEMAGDPIGAILLLAMGVSSLSMAASSIPKIKWAIRNVTYAQARQALNLSLEKEHSYEIRHLLGDLLEKNGLGSLVRPGSS
ncbi:FIG001592: Phosphocarrier protein kinase/phosphorylase, nitrogen regulation associated [hydrothermal vent metagenome]|uniref:phosphoenolpyruvate--protein phosphotransferase n=1 Tax=hydrothermal vent metagenome TaxID=652676 RepID=A0A3B0Y9N8_9ZZZZ